MNNVNYKQKYENLKAQYMNSVDTAFRLGFEQGAQQAQMDQAAQQAQQQQEMQQAAMGGGAHGQEGDPSAQADQNPNEAVPGDTQQAPHPEGSELDQHIAKLESMLTKSDATPEDLKKSLEEIKSFRRSQQLAIDIKKGDLAVKSIANSLNKTAPKSKAFNIGPTASKNLDHSSQQALTLQHKIVSDIMDQWNGNENSIVAEVSKILGNEGLKKE